MCGKLGLEEGTSGDRETFGVSLRSMILKHPGTSEWLGADWVQVSGVPTKLHSNKLTGDAAAARPGPRFQRRCSGEAAGVSRGAGRVMSLCILVCTAVWICLHLLCLVYRNHLSWIYYPLTRTASLRKQPQMTSFLDLPSPPAHAFMGPAIWVLTLPSSRLSCDLVGQRTADQAPCFDAF